MTADLRADSELEIAHVLFTDIVGYSRLPVDAQSELVRELNQVVRNTAQFQKAEAAGKLIRIPTGDGIALAFFTTPDAPVRCAVEISKASVEHPELRLRMGIHSGPVDAVSDVNDRSNVAGAGINMAQRVMDCGDAGHILLSKRIADDLAQYSKWQPHLHDLGEAEVKHGVRLAVVNFYGEDFGNEKTPEKLERAQREQEDVTRVVASSAKRKRRLEFAGAAAFALILLGIGFWIRQRMPQSSSAIAVPEKSIAVLPFDNFGDEKENAYFADGVQDDILTDLAKVADLKVISRKSVAQFRGGTKGAREIGQALGVGHLLEGSVRKAAGRIRITVQLIDTRTDQHLWAETYDRDLADIFAIQSELAQKIASALKAALSPAEKAAIEKEPTQDLEAYDLYLRARSLLNTFGMLAEARDKNLDEAEKLLEQALARDPNFLLAHCLMSDVQRSFYWKENKSTARLARAQAEVDTAMRIAPESGEAHLARAVLYYAAIDRDMPYRPGHQERALEELKIASSKLPGNVDVTDLLASIEEDRGQWKEALRDYEKAAQLNPRDPDQTQALIDYYVEFRRYADAETLIARTMTSIAEQSTGGLWRTKSAIALERGDTKAAMAALTASPNWKFRTTSYKREMADILMFERKYDEALKVLEDTDEIAGRPLQASAVIAPFKNNPWLEGRCFKTLGTVLRAQGQQEKARTAFDRAHKDFFEWLTVKDPQEPYALAWIAVLDAGAGRKEQALREGTHAAEVWPLPANPRNGAIVARELAVVYAWTGEREAAIRQLQAIVQTPAALNAGDLKLNPEWDDLRADPRFDKIATEAVEPVHIE